LIDFVNKQSNHFLDHAAEQIRCVAVTFITICGKIAVVNGFATLTSYL